MKTTYVLGVDFGGTNLRVGLLRVPGAGRDPISVIAAAAVRSCDFGAPKKFVPAVIDFSRALMRDHGLKASQIKGIGLGIPGPVDPKRGLVYFLPNVPGWRNVKLVRILGKE